MLAIADIVMSVCFCAAYMLRIVFGIALIKGENTPAAATAKVDRITRYAAKVDWKTADFILGATPLCLETPD